MSALILFQVSCFVLFFETAFLYVALGVLEFSLWTRLALNSQRSPCHCLLSARIKGAHTTPGGLLTLKAIEVWAPLFQEPNQGLRSFLQ